MPERGKEAANRLVSEGIDARPIQIDVTDPASVEAAARQIETDFAGRLDILINNAGISQDKGVPSETDLATFRATFETNVFGVFTVTKIMLPLLRKSPAGRIVNMSSGLGSLKQNGDPNYLHFGAKPLAYNSSKAALNMQTVIFAYELASSDIKINSADPGFTATDLNQHRGTRTVEEGARAAIRLATLPADGPSGGYFDENGPVPW